MTEQSSEEEGPISESEIRAHVNRILASPAFLSAPQLASFLKFVVEETLAGRGRDLKGYTIATQALGRPPSFDPQTDPIVRVQAGRLRQALIQFHNDQPEAQLTILLDRGSYEPSISRRISQPHATLDAGSAASSDPVDAMPAQTHAGRRQSHWPVTIRLILMALMLGFIAMLLLLPVPERRASEQMSDPTGAAIDFTPTIRIDPASGLQDAATLGFVQRLRSAISLFDDVVVVDTGTPDHRRDRQFRLEITMTPTGLGEERLLAQLLDGQDGRLLWTRDFPPAPAGPEGEAARVQRLRSIATTIAQPYGVIQARLRSSFSTAPATQDPYACLIRAFDYWTTNDASTHLAARTCLTELLRAYPQVSAIHAQLAYLAIEEHRQGFNPLPGDALTRALESARTAVRYAPASARAQQALLAAHFTRKELSEAWRAAARARELNPHDTEIMADVGARHVQMGDSAKGLALLEAALELNTAPPSWAITYRALALYMLGRVDEAAVVARGLDGTRYAPGMIALVLSHYQKRDLAAVRLHLNALKQHHPDIARDPIAYLERLTMDAGTIGRIVEDYRAAERWLAAQQP